MTLKCTVEGADVQNEDSWQLLNAAKGLVQTNNVGPVVFEYGLVVSQDAGKGVSCTVTWGPGLLKGAPIIQPPQKSGAPIRIEIEVGTGSLKIKVSSFRSSFTPVRLGFAAITGKLYIRDLDSHVNRMPCYAMILPRQF